MTYFDKSFLVGFLLAVLVSSAALIVVLDTLDFGHSPGDSVSEEFQRTLGGLGCGPAVDLSHCCFSFDPRLCEDCSLNHDPVPGSVYFCRQHACSILYCRPLVPAADRPRQE